jgi:hypothetical protein
MSLKSRGIFKKFLPVFLLLIIVTAVCVPFREAKAWDLVSFNIFDIIIDFIAEAATDEDNKFFGVIYWLAYRVISLGLYATTILVYFGAWLVDVFLDENIYKSVLNMEDKTSAVYIGWTTVRDFCNTFFILFLLLIAFSTILRIQTYNAKSLLPKFIISLFLINFSAVIAMIVIDFGQVFMFEIKNWMGVGGFSAPSGAGSPLTTIVDYFHNEYGWHKPPPHEVYNMSAVVGVTFAVAYSAILGLLYIMLALFLLVRIIVFVILVIISPFAFFSIILPGMRTYTSQWWSSLVSHAIFGPVFLFFIFLSGKMAQSMETFSSTVAEPDDMKPLSYIIAKLIPHVVALGMLAAAIPVTQKLGVAGAGKIMGGTAGLGKIGAGVVGATKLAVGGVKKGGRSVANRSEKVGGWIDRRKQQYGEALGKVSPGEKVKYEAGREKQKEEDMKTAKLELVGDIDIKNADKGTLKKAAERRGGDKRYKALYLQHLAANGELGELTDDQRKKYMPSAQKYLGKKDMEELTDKSLTLAMETDENKEKVRKLEGTRNAATGNNYTTEEADLEVRKDLVNGLVEKGKTHELQDTKDGATAKAYREVVSKEQKKSNANRMSKKQREELAEGYMENTLSVADYATATADQKKEDLKYKTEAVNVGKELTEAFASGGADAANDIEKAFSKFDSKRIAKFTEDELRDHGHAANSSQIRSMNRDGKQDELEVVKIAKETKKSAIEATAMGGPLTARDAEERDKMQKGIDNIESMIKGDKY